MFRQRFGVLVKATKGVVVASQQKCIEALEDLVEDGELTPAAACKILGFQMGEQAGVDFGIDRSTKWRYRQMVREAGVVLTESALDDEIEIDLGARMAEVLDEAIWARS